MRSVKKYGMMISFFLLITVIFADNVQNGQKKKTPTQVPSKNSTQVEKNNTQKKVPASQLRKKKKGTKKKAEDDLKASSKTEKKDLQNDDTKKTKKSLKDSDNKKEKKIAIFQPKEHFFRGGVSVVTAPQSGNAFYVGGNDGFVSRYSYPSLKHETWQVSTLPIKHIAVHPHKEYLLIYETDDFNVHRVSLLSWKDKRVVFSKRFSGTVVSISWSAKGNYIFVGHTSNEGITVMSSAGRILSVFKKPPGVVMLATTGKSERNVITYGQSGRLIYTGLKTRKELMQHETIRNINYPHLIKRNTEIVGYKSDAVVVINALSGQQISKFETGSEPMFANQITDTVPVWIEHGARRNTWQIRRGDAQSPLFRLPQRGEISAAKHVKSHIVVGTDRGFVYLLQQESDASISVATVNDNQSATISELQSDTKHFFIQRDNSIYALRAPNTEALRVLDNVRGDRFTILGNGFVCWTHDQPASIYYYSLDDKRERRIYRPKSAVKSVSVYKDHVLVIEAFNGLSVIDTSTGKKVFSHQASGLQNAVQINKETILIAKSAGDKNKHPLEIVNIKTHETLPLKVKGDIAFGLKHNKYSTTILNCFIVNFSEKKRSTVVTRILLNPKQPLKTGFYSIFSYGDEELNAFLIANDAITLTNLGRGKLSAYKTHSRRSQVLARDYSLPVKAEFNDNYILTVNADGTVSWYDQKTLRFIKTERFK